MQHSTRRALSVITIMAFIISTQLYSQSGKSVPGQLNELNSNVTEISNQIDDLLGTVEGLGANALTPSQFVDVELNLGSGDCTSVGTKFDTLLLPDGSEAPFEIPEGHVLVVTGVELLGFGADPGDLIQTRIFRGIGVEVNLVAKRESTATADGRVFHIYEFHPGVVVASGGEVCTNNNLIITTTGVVRGYLAEDE